MSNPIYIAKESTLCEVKTAVGTPAEGASLTSELSAIKTSIGAASGQTVMGKLNEIAKSSEWIYTKGDTLLQSFTHNAIDTTTTEDVFFPKKLTMGMGGSLTIKGTLACLLNSGSAVGAPGVLKVFVNDVLAASTEFTDENKTTISVDVTFQKGDVLKIAINKTNGTSSKYVRLFADTLAIYGSIIQKATLGSIALSDIS